VGQRRAGPVGMGGEVGRRHIPNGTHVIASVKVEVGRAFRALPGNACVSVRGQGTRKDIGAAPAFEKGGAVQVASYTPADSSANPMAVGVINVGTVLPL